MGSIGAWSGIAILVTVLWLRLSQIKTQGQGLLSCLKGNIGHLCYPISLIAQFSGR